MDGLSKLTNVLLWFFFVTYYFCKWIGNNSLVSEKVDIEKKLKENFVAYNISIN